MELTLHPLNRDFSWPDVAQADGLLTNEQIESWNRDGYFLLKSCFTAAEVKEVRDTIDPFEAEYEAQLERQGGSFGISKASALTFTTHLVPRSEKLKQFARHPVFAELCRTLLGPDARLYWDQAVYKKPGNPDEFPWHQDNGYTFVEPQTYLTCWVPLNAATIENGCPWVVPGIHRQGTLRHHMTPLGFECLQSPPGAVPVCAEAGDIVVFSSLTPHRTGPNQSDQVRKAYILQYGHSHAEAILRDGERLKQDDPSRQFPVVLNGEPVA